MTDDVIASREPRGPRSDRARIALAALGGGLAVVLIGAGAVAVSGMASADTGATPTPSTSGAPGASDGSQQHPVGPGHGPGPMGEMFGGLGGLDALGQLGEALHGSAVVKDDDGSFVTYEAQRGQVTAVSASSISVKSEDGYEHTYVVNDTTTINRDGAISDISTGDEVLVVAKQDGSASIATRIIDLADIQQRLDDMMQRFQDRADAFVPQPMHRHHGDKGSTSDGTESGGGSGSTDGGGDGSSSPAPTPSESPTT